MALTRQSTITISIVCSPEQLADVQARVSALQADLYRLGVAFSDQHPLRPAADQARIRSRSSTSGVPEAPTPLSQRIVRRA